MTRFMSYKILPEISIELSFFAISISSKLMKRYTDGLDYLPTMCEIIIYGLRGT